MIKKYTKTIKQKSFFLLFSDLSLLHLFVEVFKLRMENKYGFK